jgi:EmrB/QacA subfamily drug resistance transporter
MNKSRPVGSDRRVSDTNMKQPSAKEAGQAAAGDRPGTGGGRRAGKREWQILAVVLVGSFMAVLDTTIVNVALPSIGKGIHADPATLEWVVSGYALMFGLGLVPMGRIGDRFGYKPLFVTGLIVFTLASVGCGVSQSPVELIVARFVQGAGASVYYPAISATIQRTFSGRDRSKALGALGSTVGVSTTVGPLLGGALIEFGGAQDGWRWVFLINLFIGAAAVPVAVRVLPRRHEREQHGMDPVGNALLAAALLLLMFPLVEGRAAGWPWWSWLCFGGFAAVASVLWGWEARLGRRGGEPVIRLDLMRHRSFGVGQLLALSYFAGFTSLFFTLSILWQEGLGRSAIDTGLLVVPFAFGSLVSASNSARVSNRFGRSAIIAGTAAMLIGQALMLLALHLSGPKLSAWALIGPLALAGLGNGIVIAPNQDFVLGSVPPREAGTAGGALITAQRIGAAIGIAVIGTAMFGTGSGGGSSSGIMPQYVHTAQTATFANLAFILAALICARLLPRRLGDERDEANR